MNLDLRYLGTSGLRDQGASQSLSFAPNLARPPVFFDGELRHPLRFREAMSALHEVVVGDLRPPKKNRTRWQAWKADQARDERALRETLLDRARVEEVRKLGSSGPPPPDLDKRFRAMHRLYWDARVRWANELSRNDPALFRALVPCDPVVTVAPDVVFFECFAKDESSYGCLTVQRDAFGGEGAAGNGTTNVDYSLGLYEHFQTLRTYRPTRLFVDPSGFEVRTAQPGAVSGVREEKIDLPPSWLRGFGQIQAAMALPATRVTLPVEVVYSVLAFLRRHREKTGPRSLRLVLVPGAPPTIILDPWGIEIRARGPVYEGTALGEVKLWGRRRLMALARLLPLTERFEVTVLGSGLPSIWTAFMGEMRFVLALSGWTANDWSRGSNLEAMHGGMEPPPGATDSLARYLETTRSAPLLELERQLGLPRKQVQGALFELAKRGQCIHDIGANVYRWRPILPVALSETLLGPESPEIEEGKRLAERDVKIERDTPIGVGRRLLGARVGGTGCEGILDLDGGFSAAKCSCSFFHQNKLRRGPCRHLFALRAAATRASWWSRVKSAVTVSTAPEQRQGLVVHLPANVLTAMQQEADRRGETLHVVAEQAYRIARDRIARASQIEALLPADAAGAYRSSGEKTTQLLSLPPAVEADIQRDAARLDVTVSRIVEASWALARDVMRNTSSLLR